MISPPTLDTKVTAVTAPPDPQSPARPPRDSTAGADRTASAFPATLQSQQNQAKAPPELASTAAQPLAARIARPTDSPVQGPATVAVFAAEIPALVAAAGAGEAAADDLTSGAAPPTGGKTLPTDQDAGADLQALVVSLTTSPAADPMAAAMVAPLANALANPMAIPMASLVAGSGQGPPSTPAPIAAASGDNLAEDDHAGPAIAAGPAATDRSASEALRIAIAALSREAGPAKPAEAALKHPGDYSARQDFATLAAAGAGTDAPVVASSTSTSPASTPQLPTPAATATTPQLQPAQPTLRDVAMLLQNGSAVAAAPQVGGTHGGPAVQQLVLPATTDLPALRPLGDPGQWSQSLGDRLLVMADQGLQSATLRLQPEHLGPMEIRIRVEDGNAQVWFSAHHGDTRSALQDAIPRLREMFSDQGMNLLQANVDAGRGSFAERGSPLTPVPVPEMEGSARDVLQAKSAPAQRVSAWRILAGSGQRVDLLV
jgi:flagellar hook-length control protein FliK